MSDVVPFAILSNLGEPAASELAIALGAEFAPVDVARLDAAVSRIVADLLPARGADPEQQLLVAEQAFARHLQVEARSRRGFGIGDLLPHEVAVSGRGHELAITAVALEAARRAGLRLALVASPDAVYVGHPRLNAPVLLAATPEWFLLDARELDEPRLAWQCAHEVASLLLGLLLRRTRETGLLAAELRAAELCLALPVEEAEQQRFERQLAAVRTRLN